jgi:hypothetical protein
MHVIMHAYNYARLSMWVRVQNKRKAVINMCIKVKGGVHHFMVGEHYLYPGHEKFAALTSYSYFTWNYFLLPQLSAGL